MKRYIMEKSTKLMLFCILLTLLMFGFSCGKDRSSAKRSSTAYLTGTEGLTLRLLPNAPPAVVYNGDEFEFLIEVYNRGGFPNEYTKDLFGGMMIELPLEAKLYVSGLDTTYFPIFQGYDYSNNLCDPRPESTGCTIAPDLYGKDPYNSLGNSELMTIKAKADLRGIPTSMEQKYKVEVCYKYVTYANPSVCIDPDPFTQRIENEICSPHDVTLTSQAAPIAITRIEQETTSSKTKFRIYIRNLGRGFPYSLVESIKGEKICPDFDYEDINKVRLSSVYVSNIEITQTCRPLTPEGEIRLINNEAVITCEFCHGNKGTGLAPPTNPFTTNYVYGGSPIVCVPDAAKGLSAYETPIRIVLGYGYYDSIQGSLRILQN